MIKENEPKVVYQCATGFLGSPVRVEDLARTSAMAQVPGEHDGLYIENRPDLGLFSLVKVEQRILHIISEDNHETGMHEWGYAP